MTAVQEHVVLPPDDAQARDALAEIADLVSAAAPELLGRGGRRVPLSGPVCDALVQVVSALLAGKAVTMGPFPTRPTTQQAADLLGVRRPRNGAPIGELIPLRRSWTQRDSVPMWTTPWTTVFTIRMAPEVHGLLDTNIFILRRQIDHARLPDTMWISAITLVELAAGRKPRVRTPDLMIASVAVANRLPLYTTNPDDFAGLDTLVTVVPVPFPR